MCTSISISMYLMCVNNYVIIKVFEIYTYYIKVAYVFTVLIEIKFKLVYVKPHCVFSMK